DAVEVIREALEVGVVDDDHAGPRRRWLRSSRWCRLAAELPGRTLRLRPLVLAGVVAQVRLPAFGVRRGFDAALGAGEHLSALRFASRWAVSATLGPLFILMPPRSVAPEARRFS